MELIKHINKFGKEVYEGVEGDTLFISLDFHTPADKFEDDQQLALHTNIGSLTILDRMTGFGIRDTETGYRSTEGKFWLASGGCDVRDHNFKTIGDAIVWVKKNANTCRPLDE